MDGDVLDDFRRAVVGRFGALRGHMGREASAALAARTAALTAGTPDAPKARRRAAPSNGLDVDPIDWYTERVCNPEGHTHGPEGLRSCMLRMLAHLTAPPDGSTGPPRGRE